MSTRDDEEEQHFSQMRQGIYDMMTRNEKSKNNTSKNVGSLMNIYVEKGLRQSARFGLLNTMKLHNPLLSTPSIAFIEDESEKSSGLYFFEHDQEYKFEHAFHLNLMWIFANGPQMSERIRFLQSRVKESGFRVLPISSIINQPELKPFKHELVLRGKTKLGDQYITDRDSSTFIDEVNESYADILKALLYEFMGFIIEYQNPLWSHYIHYSGYAYLKLSELNEIKMYENDVVVNQS
mmetsp:Transcript_5920/g.5333  ORF Transcript_5920/g.5333 Transcript_5920/m.5333 type:complete len:237 (-) Transcript_5920:164-874(-)|eukprot:CAMPEP_0170562950 /NCGR_PEP_ID=MMETSP0211-20121228/63425_1 /TAXON_ID=311385 /ORGANISM="Pseudokeronopsis sp., Strain OXSARD2" /LENGTH=236 /DNA_ID=CAMNT_0010880539 /DNA_START=665 /DNA_END=1375 /DNA_ORIENTATION=-